MRRNRKRYRSETTREATYVKAAAVKTLRAPESSFPSRKFSSLSIFIALDDAPISTGSVTSANTVDSEYKSIPNARTYEPKF